MRSKAFAASASEPSGSTASDPANGACSTRRKWPPSRKDVTPTQMPCPARKPACQPQIHAAAKQRLSPTNCRFRNAQQPHASLARHDEPTTPPPLPKDLSAPSGRFAAHPTRDPLQGHAPPIAKTRTNVNPAPSVRVPPPEAGPREQMNARKARAHFAPGLRTPRLHGDHSATAPTAERNAIPPIGPARRPANDAPTTARTEPRVLPTGAQREGIKRIRAKNAPVSQRRIVRAAHPPPPLAQGQPASALNEPLSDPRKNRPLKNPQELRRKKAGTRGTNPAPIQAMITCSR